MNNKLIKPGNYFMNGNFACAEGALIAGLEFYAGYPITPSSEIMERLSYRLPQVGGHFIEMEDEIASMAAIIGASNAGAKSMTATSGPGFSLMQENIGLAIITETPVVIVDEMRGGPSTGLPTRVGQGDVMQAMWGTHGDHEAIVYAPNSVQEMFDLTIKAFNTAEKYRYPVIMLTDQVIGHMSERLTVKQYEEYEIVKRELRPFPDPIGRVHDFTNDFVSMVIAGKGFHYNIDSLTHDEKGYPSNDPMVEEMMVKHLLEKIRNNEDKIVEYKEYMLDDAEIVIISYGITSRSSIEAIRELREKGIRVGMLRPITLWPFPKKKIIKLSEKIQSFYVPEINFGQYSHAVREYSSVPVNEINFPAGSIPDPKIIVKRIEGDLT
ncbi:MAG: 2-oxoacid:acceptor oxidoreductase subunit alpha [Thermoplasmata archaeon]